MYVCTIIYPPKIIHQPWQKDPSSKIISFFFFFRLLPLHKSLIKKIFAFRQLEKKNQYNYAKFIQWFMVSMNNIVPYIYKNIHKRMYNSKHLHEYLDMMSHMQISLHLYKPLINKLSTLSLEGQTSLQLI